MATGWPMKTTYADGDVYAAQDVNDITGTINLLGSSVAYAAGKNKIINGDFYVNQRAFTSSTVNGAYTFDRWQQLNTGGTVTVTPQTFTLGAAPVAGYEGKNYAQIDVTGQSAAADRANLNQKIESVRTFAGQTANVSFWAKASSGTPSIAVEFQQEFGTGGSPSSAVNTTIAKQSLTTNWTRYSFSVNVPSISGKTLGTGGNDQLILLFWFSAGSDFNARTSTLGTQTNTFQIWGVQVESGSTATAFQTATGTIQGELAACQRYYVFYNAAASKAFGYASATTGTQLSFVTPVQMRALPTFTAGTSATTRGGDASITPSAYTVTAVQGNIIHIVATVTGATANRVYIFSSTNGTELSAEL
jgi:hypothetical protein